jgi:hypothetical protein
MEDSLIMQTVYQYNAKGFYTGETTAYMVTPEKGEAYLSMPHNCTAIAPERKEGFIPRWTDDAWEQVEDHRGETGYINGVYTEIKEPGALPEGWTTEAPKPDPAILRRAELMAYLSSTDYAVVKMAESGLARADWLALEGNEKYAEVFAQRAAARAELAGLEG